MRCTGSELPGVLIFEPQIHEDERGSFFESFHQARFDQAVGAPLRFVQDNQSVSWRGVLRGLHYQLPPHAQGKLLRVVMGEVFDVVVDVRRTSLNFGRWAGIRLSAQNRRELWIPPGFAHGFLTLSESAVTVYKVTDYWAPEYERAIAWNDPAIGIEWPAGLTPQLSAKDAAAPRLADAQVFD